MSLHTRRNIPAFFAEAKTDEEGRDKLGRFQRMFESAFTPVTTGPTASHFKKGDGWRVYSQFTVAL